jgi:cell division transport system permease protein
VTGSLSQNPFPSALEVRLRAGDDSPASAETLARDVAGRSGVADVQFDRAWLARLLDVVSGARMAGAVVAGILMLGAAFTVGAVVRLSLYARRDELEIMALVGAPFSYIRGPFVFEGLLLGGLGAAVALVVVGVLYYFAGQYQPLRFLGYGEMALVVVGGIVVGAGAGTLASRAAHR